MKAKYFKNSLYYLFNEFKPGRPTLIFIHGLSGSSSAWFRYINRFKNEFNLVAYDLRGHGKSIKPKKFSDYAINNFARELYDLISYLKITDPILVSHSFGTLIALEFLAEHQNEVKAAIFLSPDFNVKKRKLAHLVEPFLVFSRIFSLTPQLKKSGKNLDYSKYENTGDWNLLRMRADIFNTSPRVYFYCLRQSFKFNREDFLKKIRLPILIIHGEKDTIVPVKNAVGWSKMIKSDKLILLKNANHIIVLNNYPEVASAIEKFVSGLR